MTNPSTHLAIVRAAGLGTDEPSLEARVGFIGPPSPLELAQLQENAINMYEAAHDRTPSRVAAAVLPWVEDLDGERDQPEDDSSHLPNTVNLAPSDTAFWMPDESGMAGEWMEPGQRYFNHDRGCWMIQENAHIARPEGPPSQTA